MLELGRTQSRLGWSWSGYTVESSNESVRISVNANIPYLAPCGGGKFRPCAGLNLRVCVLLSFFFLAVVALNCLQVPSLKCDRCSGRVCRWLRISVWAPNNMVQPNIVFNCVQVFAMQHGSRYPSITRATCTACACCEIAGPYCSPVLYLDGGMAGWAPSNTVQPNIVFNGLQVFAIKGVQRHCICTKKTGNARGRSGANRGLPGAAGLV